MQKVLSPEQEAQIANWSPEQKRKAIAVQKALTILQRASDNDTYQAMLLIGGMIDGILNHISDTEARQIVALWFIRKLAGNHNLLGPLN